MSTQRDPLFDILEARGIRPIWFAERMGVSPKFLSMVKHGRKRFPAARRARASEILGVPEHLLFRTAEE